MAGGPLSIKEEMEMSMDEDLILVNHGKSQEHLVIAEIIDHGSRSRGTSQRRKKLESKAAGSAGGQHVWNVTDSRPRKMGTQLPVRRMAREPGHGDGHPRECPGSFHGTRFHYECNSEEDMIAEIGLEETHELEIEAIRKQQRVNNERLSTLEDQEIARTQREVMLFSMLLSVCIVNLWLWIRQ
ncbi:fetal and adult testis-expressed transcript protein isoform X1 [Eptesicus fuscus]|uniref:fetal and adult testis-expressed transcript protein isoform X1 n=1 Tax=Eptesicus fuscus TaxID=29078 RepID=UPI00046B78AA|nr:fetal and adult testis-expressed transcript protein isoform X1 [Eptesicus fuscus]XP_054582174.1 fetal and adult testis-expressed transcript protein isoform X1 [Eptesicus fuscus]